jgi:hypothetical protein
MRKLQYILKARAGASRIYQGRGDVPDLGTIYMVYIGPDGEDIDKPEEWTVETVYRELWKGAEPAQAHFAEPLSVLDEVHESVAVVVVLRPKGK